MAKKHLFKKHRKERGKYGFTAWDTYDLVSYLTRVVGGSLRELAKEVRGCPGWFYAKAGENAEQGTARWVKTLNEIADGLDAGLDWFNNGEATNTKDPRYKAYKRAMRKLSKHWFNLWY